jgi:hypothetical protein
MATPLSELQQAILDALSTGDAIQLVPVKAIRGAGKKTRAGSVSFSRALARLADRNLVQLYGLRIAGPRERVTHILLTDAGLVAAADASAGTRAAFALVAQASEANIAALTERLRPANSRRCDRCLSPMPPDAPHCRHCFATFNGSVVR